MTVAHRIPTGIPEQASVTTHQREILSLYSDELSPIAKKKTEIAKHIHQDEQTFSTLENRGQSIQQSVKLRKQSEIIKPHFCTAQNPPPKIPSAKNNGSHHPVKTSYHGTHRQTTTQDKMRKTTPDTKPTHSGTLILEVT